MPLTPGTRLGPYEILSLLGEGGMGEVYRARDPKLNRVIAIKVLPEATATDPYRRAQFEREAQSVAALNHPNIVTIHSVEQADGILFLTMELVDGRPLSDLIPTGGLPLDRMLTIGIALADAVSAAHLKGILHRDLKPANVMVAERRVKVLDFGLAKLIPRPDADMPGLTATLTGEGRLVGTVAYMSPEQAEGTPIDTRSDLFSLGVILYEMATGERPFTGDSPMSTLTSILRDTPRLVTDLNRTLPRDLAVIVRRCLAKDPDHRTQSAKDLRSQLEDLKHDLDSGQLGESTGAAPPAAHRTAHGSSPRETLWWAHLELSLPDGVELFTTAAPAIAVSPDGSRLAFVGVHGGTRQLFVRRLDEPRAAAVRGVFPTTSSLFFSSDGDAVGIIQVGGTLVKVTLRDGLVIPLADGADFTAGATWTGDGRIVFVRDRALWQVSASGGPASPLLALDRAKGEVAHAFPTVIGRSTVILFASITEGRRDAQIEALSLGTGTRHFVVAGTAPVGTLHGHVVFFRDGALFAVGFDPDRLAVSGPTVRTVENVAVAAVGGPLAAVSERALVYASTDTLRNRLVWVTHEGVAQPVTRDERDYFFPRLSPDGRRIAVGAGGHLWIYDIERATFTRITPEDIVAATFPVWTRDGTRVVFAGRGLNGAGGLYWVDTDGAGRAHLIPQTSGTDYPTSTHGDTLVFLRVSADTSHIYTLSLQDESTPGRVLSTSASEGGPEFSPDGRWLAYTSDYSGEVQVYVRPVTGPDRRWPVSTRGGRSPKWSRSGRELFYLEGQTMMMVTVESGAEFALSPPVSLFERSYALGPTLTAANFDVAPDGRFLMVLREAGSGRLNVVVNWIEGLKS